MRKLAVIAAFLVLGGLSGPMAAAAEDDVSWLGVQLGRSNGTSTEGVPIFRVIEGSPADKGGLRARDVITSVDGQAVMNNSELIQRIQAHDDGSWIALTITRGDDERDLRVRLTGRPETGDMKPRTGWIGVRAIALPPELREHFGAPKESGVMLSRIEPGSPAESAGLELGDVVFEMDGEPVGNPAALARMVAGAGVGNRVEFLAMRWGVEVVAEATVESRPENPGR